MVSTGSAGSTGGDPDPADFAVRWAWEDGPLVPGLTCVFRVKNEARNLPWVLPPMYDAVQHVVLVDNGSDDGTAELAQRVAEEHGAADRVPHAVRAMVPPAARRKLRKAMGRERPSQQDRA